MRRVLSCVFVFKPALYKVVRLGFAGADAICHAQGTEASVLVVRVYCCAGFCVLVDHDQDAVKEFSWAVTSINQ